MQLLPYHQRYLLRVATPDGYPNYQSATGSYRVARWYPLHRLLQERFRGGKSFSDYEVGELIRLKDEYEGGVGRKG
jgi:hypothetical protein